jgi:GT2 family glycosyltransferase
VELKKSVSVIIPNYNGKHLLQKYLPFTLAALDTAEILYEIIVVDDGSSDESVQFINAEYSQINLILNDENKGFSYSCNRGIETAQHELILLLNSDVKLTPDYFEHQWKYFSRWDTFGVMGRITDMGGDQIQDAARVPKLNGYKFKTDYFYYTNDDSHRLYTFYLSGANALISAEKLRDIGGFYELFSPFYCEDIELCLRAWRLKWNCYYEHKAICMHEVSESTKNYQTANWIKSMHYRNRFYMHALHLDGWPLIGWYFQITIIDFLPKLLAGQSWIWKSYLDLFKNRKSIKRYKEHIRYLMSGKETRVTIFDIVNKIQLSVKNKKITRFNT